MYLEKFAKLVSAIAADPNEDAKEMFEFVMEKLEKFAKYYTARYTDVLSKQGVTILRGANGMSQDEYQNEREKTDSSRTAAHNAAIVVCAQINRLCDRYGVERFCPGEDEDRYAVAAFIADFTQEIFRAG